MRESTKTNQCRPPDFFEKYLSGSVLDIGCGNDPVVPHARPFDKEHGDAERILDFLPPESFDTVNSSHCLEHMRNVPHALRDWWALVRPGGYMILVVPHENLYEQGFWPPFFNLDHKATFRTEGATSWSPVSYNLITLSEKLKDVRIIDVRIQDDNYNYELLRAIPSFADTAWPFNGLHLLMRIRRSLIKRLGRLPGSLGLSSVNFVRKVWAKKLGVPTDQTSAGALAQIQCVLHKVKE